MRKQSSRPNQATRMQMKKDLTAELFASSNNEESIPFRRSSVHRRSTLVTPSSSQPVSPSPQIVIMGGRVEEPLPQVIESSEQHEIENSEPGVLAEQQKEEEEMEQVVEIGEQDDDVLSISTAIEIEQMTFDMTPSHHTPHPTFFNPPSPPLIPSGWDTTSPSCSNTTFASTPFSVSVMPVGNGLVYNRASPFENRKSEKLPNPFSNRRRYPAEGPKPFDSNTSTSFSRFSTRSFDTSPRDYLTDDFSTMSISSKFAASRTLRNGEVMLPAWWKTRSFSSASCYYPQNIKSQTKSITTMNVPSHGNLDDIDSYLTTTNHHHRRSDLIAKKERWARMKAKKRQLRRPVDETSFDDDADEEEEIMCGRGVMLNPIIQRTGTDHFEDADLVRKYHRDAAYIKEQLSKEVDGNLDRIREIRFLIASVQTYGNIDGQCMMAELAMNEFTLYTGVLERFHAIIGPWSMESEIQKRRASRHAFETHRIPLQHNFATISKRKLVEEILGRSEPSVAYRQGVKVGLYSDSCDEQFRVHLHIKNGFKDNAMMVDANERRFILVLQSELELMVESMKHLGHNVGLQYDGFPTTFDRFIIAEAFVEAVAEIIGESVSPEMMRWFAVLGQKVQTDTTTPWEKNMELHCSRHSDPKNNFCAQVTVCRTSFIILHILGTFFRRYHLRKIPTSNAMGK